LSDGVCDRFGKDFPRSPLLPAVLFRAAENAYFAALVAEKKPRRGRQALRRIEQAL